jgi:hypothetical protein
VKDPRGCPVDAANWDSTAYSPETHLYYVVAKEECGRPSSQRFLRALNIETGDIVWEVPQFGPAPNKIWTGVSPTEASRRWISGTGRNSGSSPPTFA